MDVGDRWNGWTVDSFIGEGSFGKVYRIVRKEFGHTYESALKVIRIPKTAAEVSAAKNEGMSDEDVKAYFLGMVEDIVSEVALMSELKGNSNIVSYEDHSVAELKEVFGWEIYIRMEMVVPLFTFLQDKTLTARDVIHMGTDLCRALELCHKYNIIHRDIKPENIFISRQGNYKLGDFGIARQIEKTRSDMSKKGTYSYMAPEVYKGQTYDSTVDIYSLGIVLYRFLNNNRTPFLPPYPKAIRYPDKQAANESRMNGSPLPPPCNAGEKLAEVILRACAHRPEDRYRTAAEMRQALESVDLNEEGAKVIYPAGGRQDDPADDTAGSEPDEGARSSLDPTVALFDRTREEMSAEKRERAGNKDNSEEKNKEKRKENHKRKPLMIAVTLLIAAAAGIFFYMRCPVPSVTGMEADKARIAIENAGLEYSESKEFSEDVAKGLVLSQSDEGRALKRGTAVEVVVSRGHAIAVPDITGKSRVKAAEELEAAGLVMTAAGKEYSDTLRKNLVISQDPQAGGEYEEGTEVKVVISRGITQVAVPDLIGKTTGEATAELEEADLDAEVIAAYSYSYPAGQICDQSAAAGEKVDIHSTVTIYESIGAAPQNTGRSSRSSSGKTNNTGNTGENKKIKTSPLP